MQKGGFATLGVTGRLALLRALCDACLQAASLQEVLRESEGMRLEMQREFDAERRELELRMRAPPPPPPGSAGTRTYLAYAAPLSAAENGEEELKARRGAATEALLAAIESRECTALVDAIEVAADAWHEGTTGRKTGGPKAEGTEGAAEESTEVAAEDVVTEAWCTDEIRLARLVLAEEQWRKQRSKEQQKGKLLMLRRYVEARTKQPLHGAEVLGMDARGRRYLVSVAAPVSLDDLSPCSRPTAVLARSSFTTSHTCG
jgi:hypothetical protein